MGNAWEIGSHTFSIKWVVFSITLPSCRILHHMGNAWVFFSISQGMRNSRKTHRMGKAWKIDFPNILRNPSYDENLGNRCWYFSHSMGAFFQLDSHSIVYFIICEIHGFPYQFLIAWENAAKSIELGECRKLVPIFFLTYGHFSSIRFPSYGILYHMHGFSHQFLIARENAAKSTLWAFWLFFHSIIVSTCVYCVLIRNINIY